MKVLATAIGLAAATWMGVSQAAAALKIPLTVSEPAGVARSAEPVASGVPFPMGAIKDTSKLRLTDENGKDVLAQFSQLGTWWQDNSVKWVLVQFGADVPAGSMRRWMLSDDGPGTVRKGYLAVAQDDSAVTVDTGKMRFVVRKGGFNLIDKLWVDESGKENYDDDHLLVNGGGGDLVVSNTAGNGAEYVDYRASQWPATTVEVEESGPVRAVLKITGAHGADADHKALDYTLRLYAYNDQSYVRLVYTAQCRQGTIHTFVPVDRWTVRFTPNLGDELILNYSFGTEGQAVGAAFKRGDPRAFLYQDSSDHYAVRGHAYHGAAGVLEGHGMSIKPFQLGWVDLSGSSAGVTVGLRYFWQLHPKMLEVDPKTLAIHLWPNLTRRVSLVGGEYGEKQARFFGGMAKTHEMLAYFHGPKPQRDAAWAFLQRPLFAQCPTAWYCQGTRVFGRLADADPATFKPEFRLDVQRYDRHMRQSLDNLYARREFNRGRDCFGMFNFGDMVNHVETDRRDKVGETPGGPDTHWDNNYYRFPHLMYLQFLRTGDLGFFEMASEANQHLADVDTLCWPADVAGAVRYCAGPDHIRFVGEHLHAAGPYASNTFNHFKIESHFDRYYLTGDRGCLEAGLRGAQFALKMGTGGLSHGRSVGHGVFACVAGYQATGDVKYLQMARRLALSSREGIGQGIMADGARTYYELTGDEETRGRAVNLARQFLDRAKDRPGIVGGDAIQAVAFAYGRTGEDRFLDATVRSLRSLVDRGPAREVHGFALTHSGVDYALWFLTDLPRDEKPTPIPVPAP